ncbi:hypothetical protein V1524DRAFT_433571 [Lipomyces starkeyi]
MDADEPWWSLMIGWGRGVVARDEEGGTWKNVGRMRRTESAGVNPFYNAEQEGLLVDMMASQVQLTSWSGGRELATEVENWQNSGSEQGCDFPKRQSVNLCQRRSSHYVILGFRLSRLLSLTQFPSHILHYNGYHYLLSLKSQCIFFFFCISRSFHGMNTMSSPKTVAIIGSAIAGPTLVLKLRPLLRASFKPISPTSLPRQSKKPRPALRARRQWLVPAAAAGLDYVGTIQLCIDIQEWSILKMLDIYSADLPIS